MKELTHELIAKVRDYGNCNDTDVDDLCDAAELAMAESARLWKACEQVADEIDAAVKKAENSTGYYENNVSTNMADDWSIALRSALATQQP